MYIMSISYNTYHDSSYSQYKDTVIYTRLKNASQTYSAYLCMDDTIKFKFLYTH